MTEHAHWIVANDGARLDASVCIPSGQAPASGWPAVIMVHGHGDDASKASILPMGRRLAEYGYLALCYSVRGQGASEGVSFHLGPQELFDLQTVVRHSVAALPIDRERLAVWGSSQGGWHAWMAAAHCPEVRTVVPENIFVDYANFAVPDGALSTWFFTRTMRRRVMSAGLQEMARQWAIDGDWARLRAWLQPMSPRGFADRIRCPVLCLHGMQDQGMPANDVLAMFERLSVPKRLVLGGGGHGGFDTESAAEARLQLIDRWFDHYLRGAESSLHTEPMFTWIERPGWVHHHGMTFGPNGEHAVFLHVDHTLRDLAPGASLGHHNVNHEPRDPLYTLTTALQCDLEGSEAAWPREEVAFDGVPLPSDLLLRGVVRFELHTLFNRPFAQLHAELHEVNPQGESQLVTRAHRGFRNVGAGVHRVVNLEARAVAYRVPAGHRLRVVIADQNVDYVFPVFRPWRARLFCEEGRASRVILPIAH